MKRKMQLRVMALFFAVNGFFGGLTMAFAYWITGEDRVVTIARMLFLNSGILLGILIGGLLGLWLSLGGPRRIAAFSGWLIGVFAAWLLWQAGASYVWVIEAVLVAAFGPEAAAFTSLAAFMLLFGVMRWAAGVGAMAMAALLKQGTLWEARQVLARAVAAGK